MTKVIKNKNKFLKNKKEKPINTKSKIKINFSSNNTKKIITKSKVKEDLERNIITTKIDHPLKISEDKFLKGFFKKHGFYKFVYEPTIVLLFILISAFLFEMILYTIFPFTQVLLIKNSFWVFFLMSFLILINLVIFSYFGYVGARNNFKLRKVLFVVTNIILVLAIIEIIFTFISFMTFLTPQILFYFEKASAQKIYFLYLISTIFFRSIVYIFITTISYIIFYKLRFSRL